MRNNLIASSGWVGRDRKGLVLLALPLADDEDGRSSAVRFASLADLARRDPREEESAGRFDMMICNRRYYWTSFFRYCL